MRGSVKISQMTNLFSCYNQEEFFRILVCAADEIEAERKAEEYRKDTNMEGKFYVEPFGFDNDTMFNCDYIIY